MKESHTDSILLDANGMPVESNISKWITERTTKIVIIVILSTLFLLPFFEINTFKTYKSSLELGYDMLVDYYKKIDNVTYTEAEYLWLKDFYTDYHKDYKFELFKYDLPLDEDFESKDLDDLRTDEFEAAGGYEEYAAY
jgi:hypothetical protein